MNNERTYTPKNDSDELNAEFLYNLTHTDLLVAIANGELDAVELAKKALKQRGLNLQGIWVGFRE